MGARRGEHGSTERGAWEHREGSTGSIGARGGNHREGSMGAQGGSMGAQLPVYRVATPAPATRAAGPGHQLHLRK